MNRIKALSVILGLVLALAAVVPLSLKAHKWAAGTPALAAKVAEVEERLDEKIDKDRRHELQERMWQLESRWGERFIAEMNYAHRTIGELLQFMTEEARTLYQEAEEEFRELEEKRKARAKKEKDDED